MAEVKPEQPKVTRRQFVKGAALGAAAAVAASATSCLPSPKETVPAPESITAEVEKKLRASLERVDSNIKIERVLELGGAYLDTKEGLPVSCLPVSGDTSQESPYTIGYFKGGLTLIPSFQVTLNNRGRTELWEILISGYDWEKNQLDEALLDRFEFEKIPAWSQDGLEQILSRNNASQLLVEVDKQQVALFCFNGILTQRANEPIPSGPTP